jgi:CheY-like chemotaxis protein
MEDPAMSKMKSALQCSSRNASRAPQDAERALLQMSQCVESEGPNLLAIDSFKDIHDPLPTAPDIAFIDIGLPGIDGHEVGRRIRAVLESRVLLVALTAYGREQDPRRSSQAGFDAHLLKPASYEDLTRILARAAGGEG